MRTTSGSTPSAPSSGTGPRSTSPASDTPARGCLPRPSTTASSTGRSSPIGYHADGTQRLVRGGVSELAPYPGHYEPLIECGQRVSEGQTVGLLHDFQRLDEEPFEVRAGTGGIVVTQAWGARVEQGQMILMVAEEIG